MSALQLDSSIRVAKHSDVPCLAALAMQCWLHTYATQGIRPAIARYVSEHLTADAFHPCIAKPAAVTFVAEVKAHLVGYAVLELDMPCPAHNATRAHLDKLFVQEQFWGHGYGFRLLDNVKNEARRKTGDCGIWLTVNSQNEGARAFYTRQGFSDCGITHFDLYGEKHENRILRRPGAQDSL